MTKNKVEGLVGQNKRLGKNCNITIKKEEKKGRQRLNAYRGNSKVLIAGGVFFMLKKFFSRLERLQPSIRIIYSI